MDLPIENVQSYPRPPIVEPVSQRILVVLGSLEIVDTTRALRVLETHHPPTYYIPPEDVKAHLRRLPQSTLCEWKGAATYFDVSAGTRTARAAAWCYSRPTPAFQSLKDHLAFYPGKMDLCQVGSERVDPQAGKFYGGWLTPNLRGMSKGAPGTEHW